MEMPRSTSRGFGSSVSARHDRLEHQLRRRAVHVLSVMVLRPVVHQSAPIALVVGVHGDREEAVLPADEFRDVVLQFRRGHAAGPQPDQAGEFLHRIMPHRDLADDRRVGSIHQRGAQLAGGTIEGPTVIRATDRAAAGIGAGAGRQLHAPVRAALVECEHLAGVAKQHDVAAKQPHRARLALHLAGGDDRVPVILEPKLRDAEPAIGKFAGIVVIIQIGHGWRPASGCPGCEARHMPCGRSANPTVSLVPGWPLVS